MSTWRSISDTEIAIGAGLTQPLMQSLKDNQLAITEGTDDATGFAAKAIELATSASETKNTAVCRFELQKTGYSSSSQDNSDLVSDEYYVGRGGNYAVHLVSIGNSVSTAQVKLYKNGSLIQTTTSGTGTVSTWSQLDLVPKDKIKIALVDANTGSNWTAGYAFIFIYTNNPWGDAQHGMGKMIRKTPSADVFSILEIPDTY